MGAMMPESGNPVQQSTTIRPYRGAGGVLKDQRRPVLDWKESTALPRVRVERVEREVSLARRDRCLDCSFQSFRVQRLHQMFGETSRNTFLYISHRTEATDCDAANGRIASQSPHQLHPASVR